MTAAGRFPVGLEVWGNDLGQVLDTAEAAEALGFDALYYGESPHPLNLETWTVLAAVAMRTSSLRVGPVITNLLPSYRSFPLLVRQAHALAVLSGGRLDLRTGTGAASRWAAPWWRPVGVAYPDRSERRAVLDEWLRALAHVWSPDAGPFVGERLGFDEIRLEPPVARPPVTVAAMGPLAMRVAAGRADVWEASHLDPEEYRDLAHRFDELRGGGPRPVRALEVDVVTAPTADALRRLERSFLAERGAGGPAALRRALTGPAGVMADGMAAYVEAGVERLLAACADPHDTGSLEELAEAAAGVAWP